MRTAVAGIGVAAATRAPSLGLMRAVSLGLMRALSLGAVPAASLGVALALTAGSEPASAQASDPYAVDRNLIVECLLAGPMRKLGAAVTYAMPPRVQPLRAFECETRGGEYVLYDQSDPATALRLWSKVAAGGDAEAMNRVGQLHELGAGRAPTPAEAAAWYLKAAQKGSRKAALNLASLYERGAGVERDPQKALGWYRRATGLESVSLDSAEVHRLRDELERLQGRIRELEKPAPERDPPKGDRRAELQSLIQARAAAETRLTQAGGALLAYADTGESAGQRPIIALLDPSFVRTRGDAAIPLGSELPEKVILGRVQAPRGVAEVLVNSRAVGVDRFGFFQTRVRLHSGENPVQITAVDRAGERDELVVRLVSGASPARSPARVLPGDKLDRRGRSVALVVGNNEYRDRDLSSLDFAVSDARALERVLRERYGFETKLLENATYVAILDALNQYAADLRDVDSFLLYYAGHGEIERFAGTVGYRGSWLPVDAAARSNALWIANPKITDLLAKMRARKVMVIADACYSGTMAAQGAIPTVVPSAREEARIAVARELERIPSRTVLTSGALQQTPDSDAEGRPLNFFGQALVEVLTRNEGVLDGYTLFQEVQPRVMRAVRDNPALRSYRVEQIPQYAALAHAGHEGGDFVFVPRR